MIIVFENDLNFIVFEMDLNFIAFENDLNFWYGCVRGKISFAN